MITRDGKHKIVIIISWHVQHCGHTSYLLHSSFDQSTIRTRMMKSSLLAYLFLVLARDAAAFAPGPPVQRRTFLATRQALNENMTAEEEAIALEKATKGMTAFTNKYLKNTGTRLCSDKSVPAVVIKGLAEHKVSLGAPLCPCRFYDDKEAEAKDGFWNCPCVPMRERHECHCMLFLTEDNDFVGDETTIEFDEVLNLSKGMDM